MPTRSDWRDRIADVPIPEELMEISESLQLWLDHKEERNEGYTVAGWKALLSRLKKMGAERAEQAIQYSASRNWAGIYEEKEFAALSGKRQREAELKRRYQEKLRGNLIQFKRIA